MFATATAAPQEQRARPAPVRRPEPPLRVSDPGDASEREAVRVASVVASGGPGPVRVSERFTVDVARSKCAECEASGSSCAGCEEEEEAGVMRSALPGRLRDVFACRMGASGHHHRPARVHRAAGGRRVSRPNDAWELEAERVAASVDRSEPMAVGRGAAVGGVHRCGDVPSESCPCHDSPEVGDVLRSSGSPLDTQTRLFMEERLGHDFGSVRIHADETAAASAAALEANAYTVGNHVAFARGRYAPGGSEGRRLLAHELTHVVQQDRSGSAGVGLHRQPVQPAPPPAPPAPAPPAGHIACTIRFALNSTEAVDRNQLAACVEQARAYLAGGGDRRIGVHGFASEEGEPGPNTALSLRRAERVRDLLVAEGVPADRIDVGGHGESTTFPTLEENRRVEVVLSETITFPDENIVIPRFICGPDVTAQVEAAVDLARSMFAGWTSAQRTESCEALRHPLHGQYAWDIVELHNNAWIHRYYRPYCATIGADPKCGSTVQVGTECYFAGSPNYVIFGTMCDLCYGHFWSIGRAGATLGYTGYLDFDRSSMEALIHLHKTFPFEGGNIAESKAWARAGYAGWPFGGTPPAGDRPGCAPQCSLPYMGPAFRVNWYPHSFPAR